MIETLVTLVVWGFCLGFGFTIGKGFARGLHGVLRYLFTGQNE